MSSSAGRTDSDLNQLLIPLGRFQDASLQSAELVHGSPRRRRHFRDSSRLFLLPPCKTGSCQPQKFWAKPSTATLSRPPAPEHQEPDLLAKFTFTECSAKENEMHCIP